MREKASQRLQRSGTPDCTYLSARYTLPPNEDDDLPRVHTPTPRRTGQPRQRRQPHTRIPALAPLHRTSTRPGSQVQDNQTSLVLLLPQKPRHRPRDKRITNPMKSIFPQLVLLRNLLVDRICIDMLRNRLMELAIEHCYISRTREFFETILHDLESGCVVKGREVGEGFEVVVCVFIDNFGGIVIPAMDDSVADDCDILFLRDGVEVLVVD